MKPRNMIIGLVTVSLLLVGCGHSTMVADPATKPPWVASYMAGKPTVYYVSTGEKVQKPGRQIAVIKLHDPAQDGPDEWTSNNTENNPIEVYTIPGVDVAKAVAVKFAKNGPFIKAVSQSKHP